MKYNTRKKNSRKKNTTKKQFLFNPKNPKKSFDVYIDKDPTDTIHIKYTTIEDVKILLINQKNYIKTKNIHISVYGKQV